VASKVTAGESAGRKPRSKKPADRESPTCCEPDRTPSFNQTTIEALEDAKADRNLTRYADEDELFQKLGIKVGKEKT
jgi:hypothetical protein